MSLSAFVKALANASFDVDAEAVLDALWLAGIGRPIRFSSSTESAGPRPPQPKPPGAGSKGKAQDGSRSAQERRPNDSVPPNSHVETRRNGRGGGEKPDIFARGNVGPGDRTLASSPILVPAARALPEPLDLARALRPLRHRWRSLSKTEFDEAATAELTANLRLTTGAGIFPVLTPQAEPWYDAHLVVEDDPLAELWGPPLREFVQLLRQTGAFRLVRGWRLRRDAADPTNLDRARLENPAGALVPAGAIGGTSRELVFFASHGDSVHWLDGFYAQLLRGWSASSIVVLHLLPRHRWAHTLLGEPRGITRVRQPGSPNSELDIEAPRWSAAYASGTLRLPVAPLEPRSLGVWARMQMGLGPGCEAFVIDPTDVPSSAELDAIRHPAIDPDLTLSNLRERSPAAFDLAMRLAVGPFTVPVARLVQEATATPDFTALAELMLSGALVVRGGSEANVKDTTYFDVHQNLRGDLMARTRSADIDDLSQALQDRLSAHLRATAGREFTFDALISDPEGADRLPEWARPFASFGVALRRQLRPTTTGETPPVTPERWKAKLGSLGDRQLGRIARLARRRTFRKDLIESDLWTVVSDSDLSKSAGRGEHSFRPEVAVYLDRRLSKQPFLGLRIMWVDDVPENNTNLLRSMQAEGLLHHELALSTEQALNHPELRRFDIIISDMARGDDREAGYALLRGLQLADIDVPVIIFAGYSMRSEAERARVVAAGAFAGTNSGEAVRTHVQRAAEQMVILPSLEERMLRQPAVTSTGLDRLTRYAATHGREVRVALIFGATSIFPQFGPRLVNLDRTGPASTGSLLHHYDGMAGLLAVLAPTAQIQVAIATGADGTGTDASFLSAVQSVLQQQESFEVVLVPLGSWERQPHLERGIKLLAAKSLVVVAAGNDANRGAGPLAAGAPGVLSVGAFDWDGLARFSNSGALVDLYAPGVRILCYRSPTEVTRADGTSYAALLVAAAAANLASIEKERVPPGALRRRLMAATKGNSWGRALSVLDVAVATSRPPSRPRPKRAP